MRENYGQSCIDKMWGLLQKAFKLAYSRRKIHFNVMEDETLTKTVSQKEKKEIEALTTKEQEMLIEILNTLEKNHEYSNIIKFLLNTRMRIGEVLARSNDNIDFRNKTILVDNELKGILQELLSDKITNIHNIILGDYK